MVIPEYITWLTYMIPSMLQNHEYLNMLIKKFSWDCSDGVTVPNEPYIPACIMTRLCSIYPASLLLLLHHQHLALITFFRKKKICKTLPHKCNTPRIQPPCPTPISTPALIPATPAGWDKYPHILPQLTLGNPIKPVASQQWLSRPIVSWVHEQLLN